MTEPTTTPEPTAPSLELAGDSTDLRCSVQTAALGEHPAGSAGFAARVLLVELPLPWPSKIDQHELLDGLDLGPGDIKLLGVRSSETTTLNRHRVVCWERTEPFCGFERTETVVDGAELVGLLRDLAVHGPAAIADPLATDPATEDLLICTHGTRDRCCGQLGTRLHAALDCAFEPNVRMWRASHTGGHRFAPTGIHFPHGTTWSALTPELTVAIVEQSLPTERLESHYRGNLGIQGRPAQIAEGAAFLDQGWAWLEAERTVEVVHADPAGDDHTLIATVESPTHSAAITLREYEAIPVPTCGEDLDAAKKSTPQFRIA